MQVSADFNASEIGNGARSDQLAVVTTALTRLRAAHPDVLIEKSSVFSKPLRVMLYVPFTSGAPGFILIAML